MWQDIGLFDLLNVYSVLLQMQSLQELHEQATNDDILNELQAQDRDYLARILETQQDIVERLDRLEAFSCNHENGIPRNG